MRYNIATAAKTRLYVSLCILEIPATHRVGRIVTRFPGFVEILGSNSCTIGISCILLRSVSTEKPILMFQFQFILAHFYILESITIVAGINCIARTPVTCKYCFNFIIEIIMKRPGQFNIFCFWINNINFIIAGSGNRSRVSH